MHVISKRALREFWEAHHSDSKQPLEFWYRTMRRGTFKNWGELHRAFPAADKVGDKTVFNIGGNKYRLVAVVHFNREVVFVRNVLTHKEYDEGKWKHGKGS
jgi:mRNA interferase HigB